MSLKNQAEALLFSCGKAMQEDQLAGIIGEQEGTIRQALKELQKEYGERDTALKLFNEGGLWKLLVKDEHVSLVRRIVADTELSKATLETLAVVAYNQPKVLQSKVVEMRGGNAYEHIKELVELGFVTKAKEGRSYSLRLTEKFFDYFDVEGEDSIRRVFKDVKEPREKQRILGELKVVDVPAKQEKNDLTKGLGKLEVIDEPDEPVKLEENEGEKKESNSFLEKLEAQIDKLAARNDDRDDDEDFKPAESAEEKTAETSDEAVGTGDETAELEKPLESPEDAPLEEPEFGEGEDAAIDDEPEEKEPNAKL